MNQFWKKSASTIWEAFCKRTGDAIFAGMCASFFFVYQQTPNLAHQKATAVYYDYGYDTGVKDSGSYDIQPFDSGSYDIRPIGSKPKQ